MTKTIQSMIHDAQTRLDMWASRINDKEALTDLNRTREEVVALANYFEGKRDGLVDAMRLNK